MKALLLLLSFAGAAQAQYVLDYSSGPLSQTSAQGAAPVLGAMTGEVTLEAPLPQDGTFTVTPQAFAFAPTGNGSFMNSSFLAWTESPFNNSGTAFASFTFTTMGGTLQDWFIDVYAGNGEANREHLTLDSMGVAYTAISDNNCPTNTDCYTVTASGGPGTFTKAPEVSAQGLVPALLLLTGFVAVLRGRKRCV